MTLHSKRFIQGGLTGLAILFVCGCSTVGPDYEKPQTQTPDAWSQPVFEEIANGPEANLQTWWTIFGDPTLNDLIDRARQKNLNLKVAVSRIRESRTMLAIASGEKMPVASVGGKLSQMKLSDDGPLYKIAPADGFDGHSLIEVGTDAFWEIDLFGRISRTIESADAAYEASVEDYRDVLVTLLAEVAFTYVDIRSAQQQIVIANENVKSQTDTLKITRERFDNGMTTKLDVAQATANFEATQASIPQFKIALNQSINRLAVLLGEDAGKLQSELGHPQPLPKLTQSLGIGVPANIIRQRPDIRKAERLLAAQTAQIGVATADLYPSFGLSGFFGLQSRSLDSLFSSESVTWGFGSPIQWDVFNGGQIKGNIEIQKEKAAQYLLRYELQVLEAVEEVENAISGYDLNTVSASHLRKSNESMVEAVNLVLIAYDAGLTDFNNVLVTQRDLYRQQSNLISYETQTVIYLISLYKALGGGWDIDAATSPARSSK